MWPNLKETADLVTFTEKFIFEKFVFCAVYISYPVREIWDVIKK